MKNYSDQGYRNSFIFYRSFYDAIKLLPKSKRLILFEAICELSLNQNDMFSEEKNQKQNENESSLRQIKSLFFLVRPQIKANLKRFYNGKTGGRPVNAIKLENQNETLGFTRCKTKTKPNNNNNVNVNNNVNNNDKDTKNAVAFSSPFDSVFATWIDYRKEIKKPFRSPKSIEQARSLLLRLSGGDVDKAQEIINRSMANGWQGLFPLDEDKARGPSVARDFETERKLAMIKRFHEEDLKNDQAK
jgi:hypothetical protein